MTLTFKQRSWKLGRWFLALFLAMLIFRLIYGYVGSGIAQGDDYFDDFFSSIENLRKNYASEKKFMKQDVGQKANFAASQKYEKTATVKSKTSQYEKDLDAVKSTTKSFEGI